jgi:hypothetical protein
MAGISTYISMLTLNITGLNSPSKCIIWQTGLKKKTWQSVVYKKPTLQAETNIALVWKGGKIYAKQMVLENRQEVAILISDKVDFNLN